MSDDQQVGQGERALVAIGGGGGIGPLIRAAQPFFARRSAIIAVTDTGRSTGIARAIGHIPAPGDLRATIAATARNPEALWPRLLEQRFNAPEHPALNGMAFGNLLITALSQLQGDFASAVATVAALADSTASILPASTNDVQLCAELEDGSIRRGEVEVRGLHKAPIRRLFLEPAAPAHPDALAAIHEADIVVLGPGSFFTSLMATLQFGGMLEALRETAAPVVFICNTTTQSGQTEQLRAIDHVQHLVELLGQGQLDAALINRSPAIDPARVARYAADGIQLLQPDDAEIAAIEALGVQALVDDYSEQPGAERQLWNKQDTIRHDPQRVARLLAQFVQAHSR